LDTEVNFRLGTSFTRRKHELEFDAVRVQKKDGIVAGFVLRVLARCIEDFRVHLREHLVKFVHLFPTLGTQRQMMDPGTVAVVRPRFPGPIESDREKRTAVVRCHPVESFGFSWCGQVHSAIPDERENPVIKGRRNLEVRYIEVKMMDRAKGIHSQSPLGPRSCFNIRLERIASCPPEVLVSVVA